MDDTARSLRLQHLRAEQPHEVCRPAADDRLARPEVLALALERHVPEVGGEGQRQVVGEREGGAEPMLPNFVWRRFPRLVSLVAVSGISRGWLAPTAPRSRNRPPTQGVCPLQLNSKLQLALRKSTADPGVCRQHGEKWKKLGEGAPVQEEKFRCSPALRYVWMEHITCKRVCAWLLISASFYLHHPSDEVGNRQKAAPMHCGTEWCWQPGVKRGLTQGTEAAANARGCGTVRSRAARGRSPGAAPGPWHVWTPLATHPEK